MSSPYSEWKIGEMSLQLLDNLYVWTDYNCPDVGTRPEQLTVAYVEPGSRWEDGDT